MSDASRPAGGEGGHRWYDLFSRGARDWLRHNAKLREEVREQLPDLISRSDVLSRPGDRTMRIPVRFLEHYRFRLREEEHPQGVGQGDAQPGDILRRGGKDEGEGATEGGSGSGELRFVFEFNMEDIVDWIWEELKLPDLEPRSPGNLVDEEVIREGWDRRGPRARLDRRRTMREAIKRRASQEGGGDAFTDDDLRYRQLARRKHPATQAVVVFILDVSASMDEGRRKLAKSFFFWVVHGLRRQYGQVDTVFVAHTNQAWEFTEEEFFQVSATGGTVASTAFRLAHEILTTRFSPERYNPYIFYASDGDNFGDDRQEVQNRLTELARLVNFMGFVETPQNHLESGRSEIGRLFRSLSSRDFPVGSYTVHEHDDIWEAIRAFFTHEAGQAA
ncbi:MAG: DUF444 family protein [Gammaproteobacteria bacterium]|jgi:sporulation protein YhbH